MSPPTKTEPVHSSSWGWSSRDGGQVSHASGRFWVPGAPGGTESRLRRGQPQPPPGPGGGQQGREGLPEHPPVRLHPGPAGVRVGVRRAPSSWVVVRMKRVSASEGRPAHAGSVHVCALVLPLLSPRTATEEAPRAHFTDGLTAATANSCQHPLHQAPTPMTPCHLHNHPAWQVLLWPPLQGRETVP